MGKLLSTKNRALPAVDGYVLKGNTDGSQFWAAGGIATINAVFVVDESLYETVETFKVPTFNCDIYTIWIPLSYLYYFSTTTM